MTAKRTRGTQTNVVSAAALPGATTIDAVVMAYAAATTDTIITSDLRDLERLRSFFPTVRVLRV